MDVAFPHKIAVTMINPDVCLGTFANAATLRSIHDGIYNTALLILDLPCLILMPLLTRLDTF
jgi:hypothetical protein